MPSCSALAPRAARHTPHRPSHPLITPQIKTPTVSLLLSRRLCFRPVDGRDSNRRFGAAPAPHLLFLWVTRIEEMPRLWLNSMVGARARGLVRSLRSGPSPPPAELRLKGCFQTRFLEFGRPPSGQNRTSGPLTSSTV